MLLKSIPIVLFLFLGASCYSQSRDYFLEEQPDNKNFHYRNYRFKIGVTDIFRGNLAFYYEQLLNDRISLELGAGLTFDDLYALNYWKGEQYVKRNKPKDTRYSFSFAFRFLPIRKLDFFFIGLGINHRRYYHADKEAIFEYNGVWIGSNRNEFSYKVEAGCFFNLGRNLCVDYYIGYGLFTSYDRWNFMYYSTATLSGTTFKGGRETVTRGSLFVGLRVGI